LVSRRGTAAAVSVNTIPEAEKLSDGAPFYRVSPILESENLAAAFALPSKRALLPPDVCVLTVTREGLTKKTLVSELPGPSAQTFALARVNEGDDLVSVGITDGKKDVLLVTASGMAIRFDEGEVRPMGLLAAGVSGIRLDAKDSVVGSEILPAAGELLLMASDGRAKRVDQKEFPRQGRYGKGVNAWALPKKVQLVGLAAGKGSQMLTVHAAKSAARGHRLDEATVRKRAASRGDRLVDLKAGDAVIAITTGWNLERFIRIEQPAEAAKPIKKTRSPKTPARATRGSVKKKSRPTRRRTASKKKK